MQIWNYLAVGLLHEVNSIVCIDNSVIKIEKRFMEKLMQIFTQCSIRETCFLYLMHLSTVNN